ncbi:DJ-1/PfpI family protein [Rhodococcus sp. G-MC3]|uniref:DJ-1/PfpI family protein n=1 Tax=Rhodococcus sp. G-MC3 TaxID=3046209 RepID=UPI0024BBCFE9|nr:DJ-1/PfpI family protein [Rhodococcus sp. G-MC3]MDJ0393219.1 DJ-1/PfpI family protein [Rhodococcus sp. G-MC3]
MTRTLAILMFDDVEVLDACGPFEVFSVANRVTTRAGDGPAFDVVLVGIDENPVVARGGMRISVDTAIADERHYDIVLVPGGVVDEVAANPAVIRWIEKTSASTELTASVCTGAFLLAQAGVLDSRPVTTHWEDIEELRASWPELDVREDVRYLDHGDIATSAGISAGLDLALHLVGRLVSAEVATLTARKMQYEWAGVEHAE